MKNYRGLTTIMSYLSLLTLFACKSEEPSSPVEKVGKVQFTIQHLVNGQPLVLNEMVYTNAAGNEYLVTDVMYFLSDVVFYGRNGFNVNIHEWKEIFYIDENIPSTKTIEFFDEIPTGTYDSISFVFGITEDKNQSFMYVNPPEVNMFWPEVLGGGYHYMMINGKWKDPNQFIQPFNFHLGIGQLYKGNTTNVDSIYAFVQNYFTVHLPGAQFTMKENQTVNLRLTMNIEQWFENPLVFDFDVWGGAIMQNQQAMQIAKENGWDVFSIEVPLSTN